MKDGDEGCAANQQRKREAGSKGDGGCVGEKRQETSQGGGRSERGLLIGWSHEQDGCRRVVKPRGSRTGGRCREVQGEGLPSSIRLECGPRRSPAAPLS